MTKYQLVAKSTDGIEVAVGDPEPFVSLAQIHAEELRGVLRLVPRSAQIEFRIDLVEVA